MAPFPAYDWEMLPDLDIRWLFFRLSLSDDRLLKAIAISSSLTDAMRQSGVCQETGRSHLLPDHGGIARALEALRGLTTYEPNTNGSSDLQ